MTLIEVTSAVTEASGMAVECQITVLQHRPGNTTGAVRYVSSVDPRTVPANVREALRRWLDASERLAGDDA